MSFTKLKFAEKYRLRLRKMKELLMAETQTKEQLCEHFSANERTIRAMISIISKHLPVISPSNGRGYKIATNREDIAAARHQLNENDKRAENIILRNDPLKIFLTKFENEEEDYELCNANGQFNQRPRAIHHAEWTECM